MYVHVLYHLLVHIFTERNKHAFVLHVIMPINNFKVYMPTDEPIIIYMKFIYIGDKIIRNRDDKK